MGLGLLILLLCVAAMCLPVGAAVIGYRVGQGRPVRERQSETEKINNMVAFRLSMGDAPDSPIILSLLRQAEASLLPWDEKSKYLRQTAPKSIEKGE